MNVTLFFIIAFPALVLFLVALRSVFAQPKQSPVQLRLQQWTNWEMQPALYAAAPSTRPVKRSIFFNRATTPLLFPKLRHTLTQVRSSFNVVTFLLFVLIIFAVVGAVAWLLTQSLLQGTIAAIGGAILPFLWIWYRKKQYMKNFEGQLVPALDMLARSLWAGHTIQTGIRTIGQDFDDPIRSEFSKTAEAIDFGLPLPQALEELALRVDIPDLRFFVTSVLVQRETGGNLADILARTADIIRQRLEFNDRIKALAAQGKFSAQLLFALPILIAVAIHLLNPDHFTVLFESTIGQYAMVVAGMMMVIGIFVVQRIIKIQV